jgi:hypothetical protein
MKGSIGIVLALALAFASVPALASGGGHGAKEGGEAKKTEPKKNPNSVDMPVLMAPISDASGKLVAYAYINTTIEAASASAALGIRDKFAFLQDAFLREVNRASIGVPGDPDHVDEKGLQARMLAAALRVLEPKKVKTLIISKVQVASLYPKARPETLTPEEAFASSEDGKKPAKAPAPEHH